MASVSVLFMHPLPVCKLVCLSSALLQSQCLHAVTAALCCHSCFSLCENTLFPSCLLALAFQNVMICILCLFSSGFVTPLLTGSYVHWMVGESTTCTICSSWMPNGTLPQGPGVHPMPNELWWIFSAQFAPSQTHHETLNPCHVQHQVHGKPGAMLSWPASSMGIWALVL